MRKLSKVTLLPQTKSLYSFNSFLFAIKNVFLKVRSVDRESNWHSILWVTPKQFNDQTPLISNL